MRNRYIAMLVNGHIVRTYPNPDKDPKAKRTALDDVKHRKRHLEHGEFAFVAVVEEILEDDLK